MTTSARPRVTLTRVPIYLLTFCFIGAASTTAICDEAPARVGEFPQEFARQYTQEAGHPANDCLQIVQGADGAVYLETRAGWARHDGNNFVGLGDLVPPPTREAVMVASQELVARYFAARNEVVPADLVIHDADIDPAAPAHAVVGSNLGIFVADAAGIVTRPELFDQFGRALGRSNVPAVTKTPAGPVFGVQRAVAMVADGKTISLTAEDGLPFDGFTCVSISGNTVWFGTTKGVVRLRDGEFAYRQGKRWLPDDHVTDILAMPDGSAWVATKNGVAHLATQPMTLAQKAAFYEDEIEKYIKRTEFGYTAESTVTNPGDKSEIHHHDSDNDGLWTAMYGAGECFAYAATKDPAARARAQQAFEALRFLQKVTQGGEHSPPKGYVARTILPTSGPDPNIGRIERDREEQATGDKLWKAYEPRWPKSADGQWYWKSDTSSDEIDGHYFFYAAYYDLVAETEEEKARVREVVHDLTSHLVDHKFQLIDHDGTVTRWGQYSPEALNGDRQWWVERGLNSLSMLSYLAVAEHMTGDPKFAEATRLLCDVHHYDQNAMVAKIQYGVGSGNQSDDEMAFMSYYNLIKYTRNEELRDLIRHSFYQYWKIEFPELNPLFNFIYASACRGATTTTQWGTVDLNPFEGWLDDSIATLKGFPLDRFNWGAQNSHRLDIVPLRRQQGSDPDERNPPRRGLRVNGKVLPVEERHFNHWNTDPFQLDYGGDGRVLASGAVFLLPYYMGLHHGFIE